MQRYPDIRIDLGVADRPVDLISGNVDCVIRGGPLNDSTLIARHLGDADMVTCATPGYLKSTAFRLIRKSCATDINL